MSDLNKDILEILSDPKYVETLIRRMQLYAIKRFGDDIKHLEGKEPIDYVMTIFDKALDSIRNWDKEKATFEEFVFGSLKSDINAFRKKRKRKLEKLNEFEEDKKPIFVDLQEHLEELTVEDEGILELEFSEQKNKFIELLKEENCTSLEQLIFECWCEEIYKPSEISEFLEVEISEVYNAIKRLNKRKTKALRRYE